VGFRTTRHKAVHASFEVGDSLVPRAIGLGVLGLGALALLGFTVRGILRGEKREEPAPPAETPPAGEAVPAASPPTDEPPASG
jgi:hypothetical protein